MEQQAIALTATAIGAATTVVTTLVAVAVGLHIQMFDLAACLLRTIMDQVLHWTAARLLITIMAQVLHLTMTAARCQVHPVALAQASAGCLARRAR